MSWAHIYRLQVIRATFRQCFMMEFDRAPHNLTTASNAPLRSFKRLSLCNAELQRIMSWLHVYKQQLYRQLLVMQCFMMDSASLKSDRSPHKPQRGMCHSGHSRDPSLTEVVKRSPTSVT